MSDDESTPISRPRRSSASVTQWGIVEAWLAGNEAERGLQMKIGPEGLCWIVSKEGGLWVKENIGQHEDPSTAAMRGISKL